MSKKLFLYVVMTVLCLTLTGCFTMTISGTVTDGTNPINEAIVILAGAEVTAVQTVYNALNELTGSPTAAEVKTAVEAVLDNTEVSVDETNSEGEYEFTKLKIGPYVVAVIAPPTHMIPATHVISPPSIFNLASRDNDIELE